MRWNAEAPPGCSSSKYTVIALSKKNAERYRYTDCGLDNVVLTSGFEEVDSPYGKGVSITDLDGLHRAIAKMLVEKAGALTGDEFRFLRTELDLSQLAMGALCGRNERAVRGWEGSDEIPEPANTIIRVVYRERYDPKATYEGMAKAIRDYQAFDKHHFEMLLTDDGWVCERISNRE